MAESLRTAAPLQVHNQSQTEEIQVRDHMKLARARAAKLRKFQSAVWDGDEHPNSSLKLAIALGITPAALEKYLRMPGAPSWRSGAQTGGYDLREFQQFIVSRKAP